MGNYEHKDGQGTLFLNESDNPKAPQFTGKMMVDGKLRDIAGWNKTLNNGMEIISLSIQEEWQGGNKGNNQGQGQQGFNQTPANNTNQGNTQQNYTQQSPQITNQSNQIPQDQAPPAPMQGAGDEEIPF